MLARFAEKGTESIIASSNQVVIEGDHDMTGIELKIPLPFCERERLSLPDQIR